MWHKRKILAQLLSDHKRLVWFTFAMSFTAGLLTIAVPLVIGKYYDFLFGHRSFRARLLEFLPFDINNIKVFLVFFMALVILKTAFSFLEKYCTGLLGEHFTLWIRTTLFQHQLKIPVWDYERKGMGRYLLRFSGDLNSLKNYLTKGIVRFVSDAMMLTLTLALLFWLDSRLGLFMLGGLALPLWGIIAFNRKLSKATRAQRNHKSSLLAFTNTRLRAIHTIRFFNKEIPEQGKFNKKAEQVFDAGVRYQKITSLINALIPGVLYLLMGALFTYIYFSGQGQHASASNILVFIILLLTIMPVMRRMLRVNVVWELGNISFEKLLNVLNRVETQNTSKTIFRHKDGNVKIRDMGYGFDSGQLVFDGLGLNIPGNGLTLVQGTPGSGKSTLIKLLTGLYKPTSGKIIMDGQDLGEVDGRSLRRRIAVVSDEIPLMGATVFEAISYSRKPEKRLPSQFLLDYLQTNNPELPPLHLDDKIGDLGCNLSKGQRKLLAFARAVLTNKKIILIDELFEGLSPGSIPFWTKEVRELAAEKTVVVFTSQCIKEILMPDEFLILPKNSRGNDMEAKGKVA